MCESVGPWNQEYLTEKCVANVSCNLQQVTVVSGRDAGGCGLLSVQVVAGLMSELEEVAVALEGVRKEGTPVSGAAAGTSGSQEQAR